MLALLLTGAIGWFVTSQVRRRRQFLRDFASLLTRPELDQGIGILALFRFSESLRGEFHGRPVVIALKHRIEHRLGYLVVAMQTRAPHEHARLDMMAHDDLTLDFKDGWLRATWMPIGFFIFPGRFDPVKWRGVLECLHSLGSLEAR